MRTARMAQAFSLIELLVVMGVIALLVAILVPALAAAREASRSASCQSNLHQFGVAMHVYADTQGTFCSGASDWRRDGVPTEVGWVADMVHNGIIAGQMLCPSNPNQLGETYYALLSHTAASPGWGCQVDHSGSIPRTLPDGTLTVNPCRIILGTWNGTWTAPWGATYTGGSALTAGSEERRRLVEEMIYKPGFNSNYVAAWWLVRSSVLLRRDGNLVQAAGLTDLGASCPPASNLERSSTSGPLARRLLDSSGAPSSNLPLLGDAAPTGAADGALPQDVGPQSAGSALTESLTDGPVENATMKPPVFPANTPRTGPNGWWAKWAKGTLQDYRNFAPVHRGHINILMADGSVRRFHDADNDGLFNNGFDPAVFSGSGVIGFTGLTVELPPEELISGYSIKRGEITLGRP